MNNLFKVVWNKNRQEWQAVSECASSNGKATKASSETRQGASLSFKSFLSKLAAGSLLIITLPAFAFANNLPTGGQIQAGAGQINSSGQTMTINQASQNMVVDWQSFSIGKDASVNFVQPNAQAAALNRVLGDQVSNIRGALNANGQVFLVNPNGILFSQTARVDVGSLVASTLNISNENFINGNYRFEGNSSNAVINQGNIQTLNGGTVAFIAAKIINTGSITTPKGNTLMGAGNKVVLDLGGPVKIEVEAAQLETYIEQGGAIKADGGTVYLTAKAANALTSSVINHTGITQAQTLASGEDGTIMLMGDMQSGTVQVAGTIDASAPISGKGGFVETSAAKVKVDDSFRVKADKWLIDPVDFTIAASGGDMTGATLSSNLATANVNIFSTTGAKDGDGNIYVNDEISWNSTNTLGLLAYNDIFINKDITATAGKLGLVYGAGSTAVENTSDYHVNAKINLSAGENFVTAIGNEWFDNNDTTYAKFWTVVTTASNFQAINTDSASLSKNYVLGSDLDLSSISNWTPIGNLATKFTGNFDGLGHTISNLKIKNTSYHTGLFGITDGATIKNIGVVGAEIETSNQAGILIGYAQNTTIENSYTTGKITGTYESIGGLVGYFTSESGNNHIENSYSSAEVTGTDNVGGLVGELSADAMMGVVTATASISNAYATGDVTGANNVGGLVGQLFARDATASISNAYATGNVSGTGSLGGLVANIYGGTIENSWYDKETNTATMADSATYGKTKAEILDAFSGKEAWLVGGARDEGYTLIELTLPALKTFNTSVTTLFAGGMGVDGDAYTITNWTQLQNINHANILTQNFFFSLLNDLGSSTSDYTTLASATANGGEGWKAIGNSTDKFKGTFDGTNKTISDLSINDNYKGRLGLFGSMDSATIKNIGLVNANVAGENNVGALVGYAKDSTIENSYVSGGEVKSTSSNIGGLVGTADTSTIRNSYATAKVTGKNNTGGLVGKNSSGKVENSYSTGEVVAETGSISTIGGLVGDNYSGQIINSFYDKTINAGMSDETAYGKTTTQMQDKATFVDWNIAEDSTLPSTYLYPMLVTDTAGVTSWKIAKVTTSIKYNLSDVINSYIYNGTSQLPTEWLSSAIFGDTYSGWTLGTDYKLVHNATDVTGFKNAGTYENISVEVLKTGFVIDNTSKNGKFVIAPKEVEISTSKVYDGNVNFNSGFTVKTNDIISGDAVTVSGALATASKNVGNYTNFANNNLDLSNTNYKVGITTAAITKKAITISGITASDKTYDGSTAALVNTVSVGGWIAGDDVQVMVAGNFINEEVGVNKLINLSSTYSGDDTNNYHFIDQPTTSASIIANSPVEPPAPTPIEPPAPTPVEPPAPTPVEPPAPTPVEPPAPTPVEPPAPTPVEPPAPEPVEPPIPVAPLDKPIQQVIANIQQINSNTFTPANNSTRSNSLPTTRGNAVNNISPNTGATRQIQQSGNLELVEVDEALAGQLTGLSGNTGPLMPVFVMQGGINLDGLAAGSTNDEQ